MKNTTGQTQLFTVFSKDLDIYIADKGKEKDNQGEEVRMEEGKNTKVNNQGQSTNGGKEEENKWTKETKQTKSSKEGTKQIYLPLMADWESQKLEEAQELQRGMENNNKEERSTDKTTSKKNLMNDHVTEDEEGIKSVQQ